MVISELAIEWWPLNRHAGVVQNFSSYCDETLMTEIWKEAAARTIYLDLSDIKFTETSYERIPGGRKQFIPHNDVYVNPKAFDGMTSLEQSTIVQIIRELKRYNALWHCEYRDSSIEGVTTKERAILALRKRGVLFKTELNSLHLVNPALIRRGGLPTVIATTYELLMTVKDRSIKDFKHLESPSKARISAYLSVLISLKK